MVHSGGLIEFVRRYGTHYIREIINIGYFFAEIKVTPKNWALHSVDDMGIKVYNDIVNFGVKVKDLRCYYKEEKQLTDMYQFQ